MSAQLRLQPGQVALRLVARGRAKVRCVAAYFALAHDLLLEDGLRNKTSSLPFVHSSQCGGVPSSGHIACAPMMPIFPDAVATCASIEPSIDRQAMPISLRPAMRAAVGRAHRTCASRAGDGIVAD